jgi:hypothetical protein
MLTKPSTISGLPNEVARQPEAGSTQAGNVTDPVTYLVSQGCRV